MDGFSDDIRLFTKNDYLWLNAYLDRFPDNWTLYTYAYKQAGDVLVNYLEDNSLDNNILVFPIIFLYRHYLELSLKQFLRKGSVLLDYPSPDFSKINHDLKKMWNNSEKIIKEIWPEEYSKRELKAVGKLCSEFSSIDPKSTTFRYPTDKSNKPLLPDDLHFIDLQHLATMMSKIETFLIRVINGVSEMLDEKSYLV